MEWDTRSKWCRIIFLSPKQMASVLLGEHWVVFSTREEMDQNHFILGLSHQVSFCGQTQAALGPLPCPPMACVFLCAPALYHMRALLLLSWDFLLHSDFVLCTSATGCQKQQLSLKCVFYLFSFSASLLKGTLFLTFSERVLLKEPSTHVVKWKRPVWKAAEHMLLTIRCSEKGETIETVKSTVVWGYGGGQYKYVEHRELLGQWKYSVRYGTGECTTLRICWNP